MFRGLASRADEWSIEPETYRDVQYGTFAAGWYTGFSEPSSEEEGRAQARMHLEGFRLIAERLYESDAAWRCEIVVLDDLTTFLLCRKSPHADCSVYGGTTKEEFTLYAGEDTDDECDYRPLPASDVASVLRANGSGASLDAFKEWESDFGAGQP